MTQPAAAERRGSSSDDELKLRRCGGQQPGCNVATGVCILLVCCALGIAIIIYGPSALLRSLLRLVPKEPGWEWYLGMATVVTVSIVTLLPIWPPLCMGAGLLFGISRGMALNFACLVTAAHVSIVLGRCFLQKPIRAWLERQDYQQVQRMMLVLEDNEDSLKFQVLFRFLFIPMFVRNYGPATLRIPFWKLSLSTLPHSAWASFIFASLGASFTDIAELVREGEDIDIRALKWQQLLLITVSLSIAVLITVYAQAKYTERLEQEGASLTAPSPSVETATDARA